MCGLLNLRTEAGIPRAYERPYADRPGRHGVGGLGPSVRMR